MFRNMLLVYLIIISIIQGASPSSTRKTTIILGTKVSVISCIWVTAWNTLMRRPTTIPAMRTGAETRRMTCMVSLPMNVTNSGVILFSLTEALHERADQKVPAVDQHEEHELEWHRDHDRREHHHAHRHEDARDHHVYDQERQVDEKADLERGLQFARNERRYEGQRRDV